MSNHYYYNDRSGIPHFSSMPVEDYFGRMGTIHPLAGSQTARYRSSSPGGHKPRPRTRGSLSARSSSFDVGIQVSYCYWVGGALISRCTYTELQTDITPNHRGLFHYLLGSPTSFHGNKGSYNALMHWVLQANPSGVFHSNIMTVKCKIRPV